LTGQENLTGSEIDRYVEGVKIRDVRGRGEDDTGEIGSVDAIVGHFVDEEGLTRFDLDPLEICGEMEAQGGISRGTFPENGHLQGESVSVRFRPLVDLVFQHETIVELVDENEQVIERP
jgi:hypothetical protein